MDGKSHIMYFFRKRLKLTIDRDLWNQKFYTLRKIYCVFLGRNSTHINWSVYFFHTQSFLLLKCILFISKSRFVLFFLSNLIISLGILRHIQHIFRILLFGIYNRIFKHNEYLIFNNPHFISFWFIQFPADDRFSQHMVKCIIFFSFIFLQIFSHKLQPEVNRAPL